MRCVSQQPEFGRTTDARAQFGVSRSWLYLQAKQTPGLLVKLGGSTLVNYSVLRRLLADLPPMTGKAA